MEHCESLRESPRILFWQRLCVSTDLRGASKSCTAETEFLSDAELYNAQKLESLHGDISAASQANKFQLSRIEEALRDQRTLAQASFGALQAEAQKESLEARAATTTQIHGIAEINKQQQQFERAAAIRDENLANIPTDVHNMGAAIDYESQLANIRSKAFLTEIRKGFSNAMTALSAQSNENIRMNAEVTQELQSISDRFEALPSAGSEQLSSIQSLVQSVAVMLGDMQLEMRTRSQKPSNSMTTEPCLADNASRINLQTNPDSEIDGIMARVCHFAGKITTCKYSKEAQSVIEDLGSLLGLVMQQISATSPRRDELPRKRKILCDYHYFKLETAVQSMENLRKAKRALTSSDRVRTSSQRL